MTTIRQKLRDKINFQLECGIQMAYHGSNMLDEKAVCRTAQANHQAGALSRWGVRGSTMAVTMNDQDGHSKGYL